MQRARFFTERPDEDAPAGTTLAVCDGVEGCSLCLRDGKGRLLAFAHEPYEDDAPDARFARLREIVEGEPMMAGRYERVFVSVSFREKMLVPDRFYGREELPVLWAFHHESPASGHLLRHAVTEWGARLVSALPERTRLLFRRVQPGCRFLPGGLSLVRLAIGMQDGVFIDVHGDYFDLLVTRDGRPLLFNAFHHETKEDILYFTLNAARDCRLDERASLVVMGVVDQRLHALLSRYFAAPRLLADPALATLLGDVSFNTSPFVHLLNLHTCAS
ncbi:MAG: DUF3822 family protein [Odoribacteraceae bacterium]|jgi:hypothetical protein|nr:DUF3822 family protein [Odoribacteraceae bacterium]